MIERSAEWCNHFRPPPLPPVSARSLYEPLVAFIKSNEANYRIFRDYQDACPGYVHIETTTGGSTEKDETASAGLIVGLIILIAVVLIALCLVAWWYWKKKKKGQSSHSLPVKTYKDVNYLDNNAREQKHWSTSSVQGARIENEYKVDNAVVRPITENGTSAGKGSELSKLTMSDNKVHGYSNSVFNKEEENGIESPGVLSNKSDTPLMDRVDGMLDQTLPNQTIPPGSGVGFMMVQIPPVQTKLPQTEMKTETDKVPMYGSTKNVSQQRGNALQPINSSSNVSPKKKRKRSKRSSVPCPVTDLAKEENRKSA